MHFKNIINTLNSLNSNSGLPYNNPGNWEQLLSEFCGGEAETWGRGCHSTVTEILISNHHPLVLLLYSSLDFLWSFMSGFMKCLHQCLISHVGQQAEPFG